MAYEINKWGDKYRNKYKYIEINKYVFISSRRLCKNDFISGDFYFIMPH